MAINRLHCVGPVSIDRSNPPGQYGHLFTNPTSAIKNTAIIAPDLVLKDIIQLTKSLSASSRNSNGSLIIGTNGRSVFISSAWDTRYGDADYHNGLADYVHIKINPKLSARKLDNKSDAEYRELVVNFNDRKHISSLEAKQMVDLAIASCERFIENNPKASIVAAHNKEKAVALGVLFEPQELGFVDANDFIRTMSIMLKMHDESRHAFTEITKELVNGNSSTNPYMPMYSIAPTNVLDQVTL